MFCVLIVVLGTIVQFTSCSGRVLVWEQTQKNSILIEKTDRRQNEGNFQSNEAWNYVNVRPNAHMFWWLYYTTAVEGYKAKPLVIWLQGGPGGSSTGFGNFQEIGPLDVTLKARNTTWVSAASILFIDNPVGTGYSYVTDDSAYTKNSQQIADDLVTCLTAFLNQLPDFKTIPLYIFSESYGGKMTAAFSKALYQASKKGSVKCDFRGLAMGDSWISPVDSTLSWGPYLYSTSLVDESGLNAINTVAQESADALAHGDGTKSTMLWSKTEDVILEVTGGVNVYNILDWNGGEMLKRKLRQSEDWLMRSFYRHVDVTQGDDLSALMNGPIRKKLGIIPDSVTWGGQADLVFVALSEDFMKPVVDIVDFLLNSTDLKVVVYSGQLDMIVDTIGTEKWVGKLTWPGLPHYYKSARTSFSTASQPSHPAGYVKSYDKFYFYWILDAGHMIPSDAGDAALLMLNKVINGL